MRPSENSRTRPSSFDVVFTLVARSCLRSLKTCRAVEALLLVNDGCPSKLDKTYADSIA